MNAPDPGPGYRLLNEGEIIEATDSWFNSSTCQWNLGGAGIGHKFSASYWCPHRRKVEDEDRWIPLKEQLPGSFPFWLGAAGKEPILVYSYHTDEQWTHWRPAHLPDPPEPQKSKEELIGFNEYSKGFDFGSVHGRQQHLDTWLAALRWKEKNG